MVEIIEFRNVHEINDYFAEHKMTSQFEVKPIQRNFQHPETKLMVSSISYILIKNF